MLSTTSAGHHQTDSSPSSTRPASSHTLDSAFADSAVDMNATTPTADNGQEPPEKQNYFDPALGSSQLDVDQTLSHKMRQLAAVVWTMEQDDGIDTGRRTKVLDQLRQIERDLEAADDASKSKIPIAPVISSPAAVNVREYIHEPVQEEDDDLWIDEADLIAVRQNLRATVQEMRLRQQEQTHLHDLTARKLEVVAQRCISQDHQIHDLFSEANQLRSQNHDFEAENELLREKITRLECDASRKEVAVNAMSSAVAGLEGFIESSSPKQTPTPARRKRVVVRGRGRFRGRYAVEEDWDHPMFDGDPNEDAGSQDLHDGVKAWLKGFHDVEEELRLTETPTRFRPAHADRARYDELDWGDFETPQS